GSGTKSGKNMKYRDTDRRRRTRVEAALDALENVLPLSREVPNSLYFFIRIIFRASSEGINYKSLRSCTTVNL
nr:Myc-type, basic helix-loop-helix (bHLH) domain-containing protein [Tanacetum cinerariifolium]